MELPPIANLTAAGGSIGLSLQRLMCDDSSIERQTYDNDMFVPHPDSLRIQLSFEVGNLLQKVKAGFLWNKKIVNAPYVVISNTDRTKEYGKTEVANNCLHAKFCKPIFIHYRKGIDDTFITVSVYDKMLKGESGDDNIGEGTLLCDHLLDLGAIAEDIEKGSFFLKELLFKPNDTETFARIANNEEHSNYVQPHSTLKICAHSSSRDDQILKFQFRGLGIKNVEKGFLSLGRTDPLFIISKKHSYEGDKDERDGYKEYWQPVYRSDHIDDHLNPVWGEFQISKEILCDGDESKFLEIEIWDYEENGKHRIVGRLRDSLNLTELMKRKAIKGNADRRGALEIVEVDNDGNPLGNPAGLVVILEAKEIV